MLSHLYVAAELRVSYLKYAYICFAFDPRVTRDPRVRVCYCTVLLSLPLTVMFLSPFSGTTWKRRERRLLRLGNTPCQKPRAVAPRILRFGLAQWRMTMQKNRFRTRRRNWSLPVYRRSSLHPGKCATDLKS